MRRILAGCCLIALSACATRPPLQQPTGEWSTRVQALQHAGSWTLDGRAAVAAAGQGWQASLDWHQNAASSELHLAGPLGIGAQTITRTAKGISVNGTPPSEATLSQLQERLGFALPIDDLRFWLLGVPNPANTFELTRNDQDRAQHLTQSNWNIDYDRYVTSGADVLPGRIVLTRDDVRVRIIVDHWDLHL